jgi:hypothetical protein
MNVPKGSTPLMQAATDLSSTFGRGQGINGWSALLLSDATFLHSVSKVSEAARDPTYMRASIFVLSWHTD